MNTRFLTLNTVIRKYQVETGRDTRHPDYADESELHSVRTVETFANAVRSAIPRAKITWAFSWQALTDTTGRYDDILAAVNQFRERHGDDISVSPISTFYTNVCRTREEVDQDTADTLDLIESKTGYRPKTIIAGFLSARNIAAARDRHGINTIQGNIWSQYAIDLQDGDGWFADPYDPSREHFCRPAQGESDFIDCLNLDGWTVDLVAAMYTRDHVENGIRYCSRMGVGPLETLHSLPMDMALREMQATTDAHFCDENVARNPFGWVVNNYEIASVAEAIEKGVFHGFGEWLSQIGSTYPDAECPTMGEFGDYVRAGHPTNGTLKYLLSQKGTGIGASIAGSEVLWFMNSEFRLGIIIRGGVASVMDYTDYGKSYSEPADKEGRNWSIMGEINQKSLREQDRPVPVAEYPKWNQLITKLDRIYSDTPGYGEFIGQVR